MVRGRRRRQGRRPGPRPLRVPDRRRVRLAALRLRSTARTRPCGSSPRRAPASSSTCGATRDGASASPTSSAPTTSRSRVTTRSTPTSSSACPVDNREYGIGAQILVDLGRHHDAAHDQQPDQVRRPRGLRPRHRRAGAAQPPHRTPRTSSTCAPSASAWATCSRASMTSSERHCAGGSGAIDDVRPPGWADLRGRAPAADRPGWRWSCAKFNGGITERLLDGVLDGLEAHGVDRRTSVAVAWVPGAFELPLAARRLAASGACRRRGGLGAVIRGDTAHFDFVAGRVRVGSPAGRARHRRADRLRRPHHRHRRPGPGALGRRRRQQGLRGGPHRARDGRPRGASCPKPCATGDRGRPMLRLVLPKGSLEKATLELFAAADLTVVRALGRRLPGHHRRPPGRRRADPAAPGDPPSTWPTASSTSGSPAATGSRRPARRWSRSASSPTRRLPATPSRVVLAVAEDSAVIRGRRTCPRGRRVSTEYPELTRRALEKHGVRGRDPPLLRCHRGQDPRHRRRRGRDHRDGTGPGRRRAAHRRHRCSCRAPS